ncbi:hypothetical protein GLOTRDRAFT_131508 [Gloeophyllum trabeum ATCC 11539]|uniref:Uncharacterized protein n=1 Tax=Gloeophyllum trabeum (strain ATCC 11539 / FP-39264 / Madison 617) TaxID=670483 RepID=S7Q0I9_GLOTA|nr:uncharacterized protein GLOTRDRAFT_131508 [Gloeophyllum trabeum ATCC 11539]EPQ53233.1 hypothetical protein GLOTRDRAFT_131508 [Gloeophyllum trabeum ATCC 11539]
MSARASATTAYKPSHWSPWDCERIAVLACQGFPETMLEIASQPEVKAQPEGKTLRPMKPLPERKARSTPLETGVQGAKVSNTKTDVHVMESATEKFEEDRRTEVLVTALREEEKAAARGIIMLVSRVAQMQAV